MPTNITIANNTEGESLSIAGNGYRIRIRYRCAARVGGGVVGMGVNRRSGRYYG